MPYGPPLYGTFGGHIFANMGLGVVRIIAIGASMLQNGGSGLQTRCFAETLSFVGGSEGLGRQSLTSLVMWRASLKARNPDKIKKAPKK